MMDFLAGIEQLTFISWVRDSGSLWAYPTVLWLHTIGMVMTVGVMALINLRLLGCSPKTPVKPLERLYTMMWVGFWMNAITGTILLMADASTKLRNPDFYLKMVLVFAGVAIMRTTRTKVFGDPNLDKGPLPESAKMLAWASMVCWVGAITAGRLLAYVGPVAGLAQK